MCVCVLNNLFIRIHSHRHIHVHMHVDIPAYRQSDIDRHTDIATYKTDNRQTNGIVADLTAYADPLAAHYKTTFRSRLRYMER